MSSLKVFEIAGSIAGIAGISLVVFYFLFKTIIKTTLPDLTRSAKKNIIVLMLFMVWSVTIIGMTTWIYVNTSNDGGQQPDIETVDDTVATDEQEARLSLSYAGKIVLHNAIKKERAITIPTNVGFDFDESFPDKNEVNNQCNLNVKSSLWMSFNLSKPYYKMVADDKIKISLRNLDKKKNKATFKLLVKDKETTKKYVFTLDKHESKTFSFDGCNYEFSYKGMTKREMGLQYWFKTRYIAHYEIVSVG